MPRALKSEGADGTSLASAELAAADGCCSAPFMREGDVPGVPKPSERSSQGALIDRRRHYETLMA